ARRSARFGARVLGVLRIGGAAPISSAGRGNLRSLLHHFPAAGREDRFERLDSVVRRFHEQILHDGLGALERVDEHFGVDAARPHAANLCRGAISDRLAENDDRAALTGLREVVGGSDLSILPWSPPSGSPWPPFSRLSRHVAPIWTRAGKHTSGHAHL